MSFSVTNTLTGTTTIDPAKIDANFADVVNVINGGLTTTNLASAAGIVATQLAVNKYEIEVNFCLTQAQWVAASTGVPCLLFGLSGVGTANSFTFVTGSYFITDCGDTTNASFRVEWGSYTGASSAWTVATTILSNTTIPITSTNIPVQAAITGVSSPAQHASQQRALALVINSKGTNAMSAASDLFCVSLKFSRTIF